MGRERPVVVAVLAQPSVRILNKQCRDGRDVVIGWFCLILSHNVVDLGSLLSLYALLIAEVRSSLSCEHDTFAWKFTDMCTVPTT
jgi:hypothetical protein